MTTMYDLVATCAMMWLATTAVVTVAALGLLHLRDRRLSSERGGFGPLPRKPRIRSLP
jgi:hypothetical protein